MGESRSHSGVPSASSVIVRHGRLSGSKPWITLLKLVAASLAVLLVSVASIAALTVAHLQSNIATVDLIGATDGPVPNVGAYPGGYNFLIVGSDTRDGQGGIGGSDSAELNDVTMLLHVSEDHTSAVAVSIPRDLVVPIPACPDGDGGYYSAMAAQPINVSLSYGGLTCTVATVEALTGLEIQFAGLITFTGVIELSNAVGGVEVCVDAPINDPDSGLVIESAGKVTLQGAQALAFLRSRHGVGDGSDLARISSQQVYLSSLVRTLKSDETLTNLPRLYSIALAATENMTLSSNLTSLDTLVAIAQSLKSIPLERIVFVQYPGTTGVGGVYAGKVAPVTAKADKLFELIKADEPFDLTDTTNIGSVADPAVTSVPATTETATATASPTAAATASPIDTATPSAAAAPTDDSDDSDSSLETLSGVSGQSAAEYTCAKAN